MPAFVIIPESTAEAGEGATGCKTEKTYVYQYKGLGKEMPVVMWCFAIASLSLIGIPPVSGFVSKWYLAQGGLSSVFGDA